MHISIDSIRLNQTRSKQDPLRANSMLKMRNHFFLFFPINFFFRPTFAIQAFATFFQVFNVVRSTYNNDLSVFFFFFCQMIYSERRSLMTKMNLRHPNYMHVYVGICALIHCLLVRRQRKQKTEKYSSNLKKHSDGRTNHFRRHKG